MILLKWTTCATGFFGSLRLVTGRFKIPLNSSPGGMGAFPHKHSLSLGSGREQDYELMDYPSNPLTESPFETARKSELREILTKIIEECPQRDQLILSLYYHDELTMKEIGLLLGVTESRVSQVHTKIMLFIRSKLKRRRGTDSRLTT